MRIKEKLGLIKFQSMFTEVFGLGRAAVFSAIISIFVVLAVALFLFFYLAPPNTITITSGPEGSTFRLTAEKYAKILQQSGVTLTILPSEGSVDNIKRLADPSSKVDIGFVQAGVNQGVKTDKLVSLGSISFQPLLVFYRSGSTIELLSQFTGKRVAVGEVGSGTHSLSLALLAGNGIEPGGPTKVLEMDSDRAAEAILNGTVDAVFLMGDSVSITLIRQLLHTPGIKLYNFIQADAYTRRITYLNKITLPRGSIDFGKDIPAHDAFLIAPTVELIARNRLHPALSDLLIEAAQEVHSGAGLLRRKGEFPAPIEQEIRISAEASRFYKSGKSFLYRTLPFRFASLVNRIIVVFVPMIVLLLPALRLIPAIYRWRFKSRVSRWYRALLMIEQDLIAQLASDQRNALMERLDSIEEAVNRMKVPASFADQFYDLRGHITFVRNRLRP
ncbi:MAG TPA: TAXI family TRAP transporter solute-binding subunit [Thermodesulfobacteriota bacterium]|nr:TAXI family TRAP transporter solute-binding subunit [Thermodesulfobacteriota bacterium]